VARWDNQIGTITFFIMCIHGNHLTAYHNKLIHTCLVAARMVFVKANTHRKIFNARSEEHTSELQSRENLACRVLREKKKTTDPGPRHLLLLRRRPPGSPLFPYTTLFRSGCSMG